MSRIPPLATLPDRAEPDQLVRRPRNAAGPISTVSFPELMGYVSHDFRTPLAVIREFSALVCDGIVGEVNDRQRRLLFTVQDRCNDLSRGLEGLLDFAKLHGLVLRINRTSCNVPEIINRVVTGLSLKVSVRDVSLECDIAPNVPTVYCDPRLANSSVMNIAARAIECCVAPGRVELWSRAWSESEVAIGVSYEGAASDRWKWLGSGASLLGCEEESHLDRPLAVTLQYVRANLGGLHVSQEGHSTHSVYFTVPTAHPRSIAQCFVAQLVRDAKETPSAVLYRAHVRSDTPYSALEFARCNPLALRIGPLEWLVAMPGEGDRDARLCQEVADLEFVGRYHLARHRQDMAERIRSLFQPEIIDSKEDG